MLVKEILSYDTIEKIMYFVMKVTPSSTSEFVNHQLVHHTTGTISIALKDLEKIAYDFIREEVGKQADSFSKITDIVSLNDIVEPYVDSMIVYRLESDPHKLHIYQRKTNIVPGFIYGRTYQTEFKKVVIFELLTYEKINNAQLIQDVKNSEPIELVPVQGKNIKIPAKLTQAPMTHVIDQLKKFSVNNLKKTPVKVPEPTVSASFIEEFISERPPKPLYNVNGTEVNSDEFFRQARKIMGAGLNNHVSDRSETDSEYETETESDESNESDSLEWK